MAYPRELHKKRDEFMKLKSFMAIVAILLIMTSFMLPVTAATASNESTPDGGSFDVVFVMDNSGSMADSDPDKLSFMAAQLFVDLCSNSNSRMGYVGFSDRIKDKKPIQEISGNNNFRDSFNNIDIGGGTNIGLGLSEALNLFENAKKSEYGNKQIIILLGDGNNWPTQSKTASDLDSETVSYANKIKNAGIELYTIGFNYDDELNIGFMKSLPDDSNKFYEAKIATEIPDIMSQIYMNLFNGGSKHIGDYSATGDKQSITVNFSKGMYEANVIFVASSSQVTDIVVTDPNGKTYNNAKVVIGRKYSIAKINFPNGGDWKISFSASIENDLSVDLISIYDVPGFATVNAVFESNCDTIIYPQSIKYGALLVAPQTPVKTDYIFGGWFTDSDCKDAFDFSQPLTKDVTLYAKWTLEVAGVYAVNFDMNGGTFLNPVPVAANTKVELPDEGKCYKVGYKFEGFFLDKQTSIPFDPNAEITGNITLYAKWSLVNYNVTSTVISFIALLLVAMVVVFFYSKVIAKKGKPSSSPFVLTAPAIILNALTCIFAYVWFSTYLIPTTYHFTLAARDIGNFVFKEIYINVFTISGLILPFILNILLAYVLPSATNFLRTYKSKQYIKHLLISLSGLVFPLVVSFSFGIDVKSLLMFMLLYIVTYPVNFFVSALAVSSTVSKSFSLWGRL